MKNMIQSTYDVLNYEMVKKENIFVLGEGIEKRRGNFNTTVGLYDKYGRMRLCDTQIMREALLV